MRSLILSPHLDDAALSCTSVFRQVPRPAVVNLFAGLPPHGRVGGADRVAGVADSRSRMLARIEEDRRVLDGFDVEPSNLTLLDAQYRTAGDWRAMPPLGPAALIDALEDAALLAADVGRVYAPMAIGQHPDHLATREAALALARARGYALTLYADVPVVFGLGGWPSWAREMTGRRSEGGLPAVWRSRLAARGRVLAAEYGQARAVRVDGAAKIAALRGYGPKFAQLDVEFAGAVSDPARMSVEMFLDVRTA